MYFILFPSSLILQICKCAITEFVKLGKLPLSRRIQLKFQIPNSYAVYLAINYFPTYSFSHPVFSMIYPVPNTILRTGTVSLHYNILQNLQHISRHSKCLLLRMKIIYVYGNMFIENFTSLKLCKLFGNQAGEHLFCYGAYLA